MMQALLMLFAIAAATTVCGLIAVFATGSKFPDSAAAMVPWLGWLAGIAGAIYIAANLLVADKVGAAVFMGITVTAALVSALIMDHFGLLGCKAQKTGLGLIGKS